MKTQLRGIFRHLSPRDLCALLISVRGFRARIASIMHSSKRVLLDRMAAELDYAFLAEYAKAEDGKITAVGASFTQVEAMNYPGILDVSVAGRIRRLETDPEPELSIRFVKHGEANPIIDVRASLEDEHDAVRYDGKIAAVFVFRAPLLVAEPGLYECFVDLNDLPARRLAFEALGPDV
mgnify:CR=1 FL=1